MNKIWITNEHKVQNHLAFRGIIVKLEIIYSY